MRRFTVLALTFAAITLLSALAHADACAPAKVANLSVITGKTTAVLTWNDPGDDCDTGTAASYEIRRSSGTITDTNWQSATVVASGSPAGADGTPDCRDFTNLGCGQTYYYVIFFFDAAGNRSPISNLASGTQKACNTSREVACAQ